MPLAANELSERKLRLIIVRDVEAAKPPYLHQTNATASFSHKGRLENHMDTQEVLP
jgi:hypothetical protein